VMAARRRPADDAPALPPVQPGFAHVGRFWDPRAQTWTAQLLAGEFYVSDADEVITTILGSCVSACLWDPLKEIGGMNHFMLPGGKADSGSSTRYGQYALERLITELIKRNAARERLDVKIFGGGRVLNTVSDVGRSNIDFVRAYLAAEGLRITAEDVGLPCARQLRYHPRTGRAMVRRLWSKEVALVAAEEAQLREKLGKVARKTGGVVLF
jgi:chemotaxis protein CheD